MSALAWWLIPLGATFLALVWAAWHGRPARPVDAHEAMLERERFRAAMERPMPERRSRLRRPSRPGAAAGAPLAAEGPAEPRRSADRADHTAA